MSVRGVGRAVLLGRDKWELIAIAYGGIPGALQGDPRPRSGLADGAGAAGTHARRALEASGLEPDQLALELTETALVGDVDGAIARRQQLKAPGVRLAVDDSGSGYSSLAHLSRFPVDVLKIDRSFVSGIEDDVRRTGGTRRAMTQEKVLVVPCRLCGGRRKRTAGSSCADQLIPGSACLAHGWRAPG